MCFAPQRRAIFRDRNFQNGSGNVVFCAFWLPNMLRATAACHFFRSSLPKWLCACFEVFFAFWLANVLRATAACHFSCLRWTAASAPAALASLLFEHQEPRIIEKTQLFATSLTFWRVCRFFLVILLACWSFVFWLDFSTLLFHCWSWLLYSAFQLSILSEVRLLNFLRLIIDDNSVCVCARQQYRQTCYM